MTETTILSGCFGSGAVPLQFIEEEVESVIEEGEFRKVYGVRPWFMDCQHCNQHQTYCEACSQRQARFDKWAVKRAWAEMRALRLMADAKRSLTVKVPARAPKGAVQAYADLIGALWMKPAVQEWHKAIKECWEVLV